MLNLDAVAAEVAGEPLVVTLRGKEFELPPSMPVGLTIFVNRAMDASEAGDMAAEDAATLAAVESLFGDRADEAMRAGFSLAALVQLATTYGVEIGGDGSPEVSAEASGASAVSSSDTGTPSKPTSSTTTGSTSEPAASGPEPSESVASSSS